MGDIENTAQDAMGQVKEGAGEATGAESLKNEGKFDQVKASTQQAADSARKTADSVQDAAGDAMDAAKGLFNRD